VSSDSDAITVQTLPIYEYFYSWQGEGMHMGKAAFFIRTLGCPLQCSWCDSAGTWHPAYYPKKVQRFSVEVLTLKAKATACEFVVITGGEPAIHDLSLLTNMLKSCALPSHIETSGAFPLKGDFDWITLSPKWSKLPLLENLQKANEIKIIVEEPNSIQKWMDCIGNQTTPGATIWLHPEWSQRTNPKVLNAISETVKAKGVPFRAGIQMHKYYKADEMDPNAVPMVPLGGNPKQGY
jgi:7-carboxy-7-deazaguanine synthase